MSQRDPQPSAVHQKLPVMHLDCCRKDAFKIFKNDGAYLHLVGVATNGLANFGNPTLTITMTINKPAEDLWTFTEWGGPLGNISVWGFFGVSHQKVVVTGYEQIHYDGGPRPHIVLKMQNRLDYAQQLLAVW